LRFGDSISIKDGECGTLMIATPSDHAAIMLLNGAVNVHPTRKVCNTWFESVTFICLSIIGSEVIARSVKIDEK
jgi:hypothetical protein